MSFQTVYLPSIRGITRVQNAAGGVGSTNANNFNITFGNNFTVGNMVCLAICSQSIAAPTIAITGLGGGAIPFSTLSPVASDTGGPEFGFLAWGKVITGGNSTITITDVSTVNRTWCAVGAEYSGINISPDAIPVAVGAAATTNVLTGSVTNIQPNALYIGALGQRFTTAAVNTAWLSAPGAPFTIVQQISTNLNGTNQDRGVALLDAVVTTSAARTANATSGFLNRFVGVLATMAETPAAVPTGASW